MSGDKHCWLLHQNIPAPQQKYSSHVIGIIIHNQTADDNAKYKNRLHRNTLDREKTDTDRQTDTDKQTKNREKTDRQTDRRTDKQADLVAKETVELGQQCTRVLIQVLHSSTSTKCYHATAAWQWHNEPLTTSVTDSNLLTVTNQCSTNGCRALRVNSQFQK